MQYVWSICTWACITILLSVGRCIICFHRCDPNYPGLAATTHGILWRVTRWPIWLHWRTYLRVPQKNFLSNVQFCQYILYYYQKYAEPCGFWGSLRFFKYICPITFSSTTYILYIKTMFKFDFLFTREQMILQIWFRLNIF